MAWENTAPISYRITLNLKNLAFCVSLINAYSFNTNSKSKKIVKTMISIYFKVRNCQVVLPLNVTKLSSEDSTGLG